MINCCLINRSLYQLVIDHYYYVTRKERDYSFLIIDLWFIYYSLSPKGYLGQVLALTETQCADCSLLLSPELTMSAGEVSTDVDSRAIVLIKNKKSVPMKCSAIPNAYTQYQNPPPKPPWETFLNNPDRCKFSRTDHVNTTLRQSLHISQTNPY